MKYQFPKITNISEVLPAIADYPEFVVAERPDDGWTIINYAVQMPNSFPTVKTVQLTNGDYTSEHIFETTEDYYAAIRYECRGMIFDTATGNIIRRPLHKFKNVGEAEDTQPHVIDLSQEHVCDSKIDGSMIAVFLNSNNELVYGTKMCAPDFHDLVQNLVRNADNIQYEAFCHEQIANGFTPIFEFCSREKRIVIDYGPTDQLILLAIRNIITGEYVSVSDMRIIAEKYNVPVVKTFDPITDMNKFIEYVADLEDIEGFVVRFATGHRVKIKTDQYVQIHKAKEAILWDRHIVDMILASTLDDVKAHLPDEDRIRIEQFENDVVSRINTLAQDLHDRVIDLKAREIDRKTFALGEANQVDPLTKSAVFSLFDGCTVAQAREHVIKTISSKVSSNNSYDKITENWFSGLVYNRY